METYARNIVYRLRRHEGVVVSKQPVVSFHNLTDALLYATSSLTSEYEVIDLENIMMGDMTKRFRVENNELKEI